MSEATLSMSSPMSSGITRVEVDGRADTGVAVANASEAEAVVGIEITDEAGEAVTSVALRVAAEAQIARCPSGSPFNLRNLAGGALRMTGSVPVSMPAFGGYSNETNEFLMSRFTPEIPEIGRRIAESIMAGSSPLAYDCLGDSTEH